MALILGQRGILTLRIIFELGIIIPLKLPSAQPHLEHKVPENPGLYAKRDMILSSPQPAKKKKKN